MSHWLVLLLHKQCTFYFRKCAEERRYSHTFQRPKHANTGNAFVPFSVRISFDTPAFYVCATRKMLMNCHVSHTGAVHRESRRCIHYIYDKFYLIYLLPFVSIVHSLRALHTQHAHIHIYKYTTLAKRTCIASCERRDLCEIAAITHAKHTRGWV